ncbi:unknown [Prevotella sp. CAG:924]|nr:unknown [Prevotella sp. CAG:924]
METDSYGDLSFFVFFLENIWWKQKLSEANAFYD